MLERIIYYLNRYKVAKIDDLMNAPSLKNGEFGLFRSSRDYIPKNVIVSYCSRLSLMGYIYTYKGVYKLSQKIPNLRVKDININMQEDEKLLYLYNRIHTLDFPDLDSRIQGKLSMLEALHLMQFMRVDCIDYYRFWKILDKQFRHVYSFSKDMQKYGYISIENDKVTFSGKYVPYSVEYATLVDYHESNMSTSKLLAIESTIEDELDIIDTRDSTIRLKKDFNVPALEDIKFVESYIKEFNLKGREKIRMIQTLYDSLNVFK